MCSFLSLLIIEYSPPWLLSVKCEKLQKILNKFGVNPKASAATMGFRHRQVGTFRTKYVGNFLLGTEDIYISDQNIRYIRRDGGVASQRKQVYKNKEICNSD